MSLAAATDSTIVAISTPPGQGGVGAVRLSGSRAAEIALSEPTTPARLLRRSDVTFWIWSASSATQCRRV